MNPNQSLLTMLENYNINVNFKGSLIQTLGTFVSQVRTHVAWFQNDITEIKNSVIWGASKNKFKNFQNITVTMKGILSHVSTLELSFNIGKSIPDQPQTTTENNTMKSCLSFEEPHVHISTLIENLAKINHTTNPYAINHPIDLMD